MFAVIIIDVQKCFLPGGSLATGNSRNGDSADLGKTIGNFVNKVNPDHLFITKDWHTVGHSSFLSKAEEADGKMTFPNAARAGTYNKGMNTTRYAGRAFTGTRVWGDEESRKIQKLWPEHCVQDTDGAELAQELTDTIEPKMMAKAVTILKGDTPDIDSYSAIADALGNPTPHDESGKSFLSILQESNITEVHITGIARDVCVFWTALDLLNYWIIPAAKEEKIIKLVFQYNLTRPVSPIPGAPFTDITVDQIKLEVAQLIAKMMKVDISNPTVNDTMTKIFEIKGDGTNYSLEGGRRRTRHRGRRSAHHKCSTKRSTKRCHCGKPRGHKGSRNC